MPDFPEVPIPAPISTVPPNLARWLHGWRMVLFIAVLQAWLFLLFFLSYQLCFFFILVMLIVLLGLDRPVLAVSLLIFVRLVDTSSQAYFRISKISIGMFEPILMIALVSMAIHVMRRRVQVQHTWPWQIPVLIFMAFQVLSLSWSADWGEGVSEIVSMGVVMANALLVMSVVRNPQHFIFLMYSWIAASIFVALFTNASSMVGYGESTTLWEASSGGGRSTGMGQQPNWYSMTLMYAIHTTFGMALIQKRRLYRWLLILAGIFLFYSQTKSGSRGGIYAVLIGGGLTALALPDFRKWFLRFLVVIVALFAFVLTFDVGSTTKAFGRIFDNIDYSWSDYRSQNWYVCITMFFDTYGRGIGAGGYKELLKSYNPFLYESLYNYPHGIFWGLMAHYGVLGLSIFTWIALIIINMARQLTKWTKGTVLEIFAWTMPATMISYAAWSFVEFDYNEKPFWEFLSLYTALYLIVRSYIQAGKKLPDLSMDLNVPWRLEHNIPTKVHKSHLKATSTRITKPLRSLKPTAPPKPSDDLDTPDG